MNVSPTEPFRIVYSLFQHEYLGYLFQAHAVQLDERGGFTLRHQSVSAKNAAEFKAGMNETDFAIIRLIDSTQQEVVLKKFYNRKITLTDFFLKIYDAKKGDKALQETIEQYLEKKKAQLLGLIAGKLLFIMGNDGNPTWRALQIHVNPVSVQFHFHRQENETHYFPSLRVGNQRLEFAGRNAFILCNEPAWLVEGSRLYQFEAGVDGKKLKPFLTKKFIAIPRSVEDTYYRKFIAPLIASFNVTAQGFEIRTASYPPAPLLSFSEWVPVKTPALQFAGDEDLSLPDGAEESRIVFELNFSYGDFLFKTDHASASNVSVEKAASSYIFHKIHRNLAIEHAKLRQLHQAGLEIRNGKVALPRSEAFVWLRQHREWLQNEGFLVHQSPTDSRRYFLGQPSIQVEVSENTDWFDIYAIVRFGQYDIPFLQLRNLILQNKKEFTLPNGEIAVIPDAWFTQYSELFALTETLDGAPGLTLRKYHLTLLEELKDSQLARISVSNQLERLRDFEQIEDYPLPAGFRGELRPYQKAGYNWMQFLNRYRFGGCLADDMGLGKTIQALALLQSQKEERTEGASLLVMPTSLIYNWEIEAHRFTPDLKVLVYTGTIREKNTQQFNRYDLVLTSYGVARIDVEVLKNYEFNYVILDESQAIKNPSSHVAKALAQLRARHRLILTGTPLENSTLDLWSQMSFINPGLLGTQQFFRNEFLVPIEKKNDEGKTARLYSIIKPFILRRHKSQVATELPEKIENVQYCPMVPAQEKEYEQAKSYFRNKIIEHVEERGVDKSQLILLQGLTTLRQIANHPRMVNPDYTDGSGKLEDVLHRLETAAGENHKILIFSQFVKHLSIVRAYLDEKGLKYAYLDGATKDRQMQVDYFQQNQEVPVFLLSLKAGGLGLNLTAADYVFILDPWWNPAIEAQAVDRAHRIGQTNRVMTYKFISRNTVEEKILALQRNKQRLASELITTEEHFVKSLSREDILSLLD